jgi:hypothetical protein
MGHRIELWARCKSGRIRKNRHCAIMDEPLITGSDEILILLWGISVSNWVRIASSSINPTIPVRN